MTGALILVDQPSGAGSGTAGEARNDLWIGRICNLSCAEPGNTTFLWEILSLVPGSVATLTTPTAATATLTPDVVGTWRIRLTVNGGGPGNVQTLVFRVRYNNVGVLENRGWAYPAFGEIDEESNYNGNTRGYAEVWEAIFEEMRTAVIGGGGGSAISVSDEGSELTAECVSIDVVGPRLTATVVGDDVTLTHTPMQVIEYKTMTLNKETIDRELEIVIGGLYFDPSDSPVTAVLFRLAGSYESVDAGGSAKVFLYDMGPGTGSFVPVRRSTITIPFGSVGNEVKIEQALTSSVTPGVDANQIHTTGRIYELRMYLDTTDVGSSMAVTWAGLVVTTA